MTTPAHTAEPACNCPTCTRIMSAPLPDLPRETPTTLPTYPGQLAPETPSAEVKTPEPVAEADPEAEAKRRWQLTQDGGLEGSAHRAQALHQRPDHMKGI